ncbi:MAG: transposase [Burkholderia sp.]
MSSPSGPAKIKGFALLFEAMVLMLAQQISFTAVARTVGESRHRVHAICKRYVELALAEIDLSDMTSIAVDETSYQRGHHYLTLVTDALERKVVFVTEGKNAATIVAFVASMEESPSRSRRSALTCRPRSSKASRRTCRMFGITFDKFHVVAHASKAVDPMQRTDPELNGLRWSLLKDRDRLTAAQRADFDALIVNVATIRTVLFLIAGKFDFSKINPHIA